MGRTVLEKRVLAAGGTIFEVRWSIPLTTILLYYNIANIVVVI
jgi:hypothetical protein